MKLNTKDYEEKMKKSVQSLENEFTSIRAGRANPAVLDKVTVDYYGSPTQISGVASISVTDARTIAISPWDMSLLKQIEKAILASDLGITPQNDGKTIRLTFPPLTEDRRKDLVKQIRTRNITLDWYRGVYARRGDHYRYLYASSVQDYLLSAFYNDLKNKKYDTDEKVQRIFQRQLREMVRELRKITPAFGIYLYDWHRPVLYRGGTIHTMVRQPEFYLHRRGMPSMAKWLSQAVEGTPHCVGLNLLKK